MEDVKLAALGGAVILAVVHLFSGSIRLLDGVPRSQWLSAFGGISTAYVFVHLLPELAAGQATIDESGEEESPGALLGFVEHHVYIVALIGLAVFYGIESRSLASRRERLKRTGEDRTEDSAFWFSIGSFAAYNVLVGYLLIREEFQALSGLALYTFALGVHFVVNDFGLREHHKHAYEHVGRWVIAAGVLVGWALGATAVIPERAIALVTAFLSGGIVLNVLKEELPGERRARFRPFATGALLYTILLQLA